MPQSVIAEPPVSGRRAQTRSGLITASVAVFGRCGINGPRLVDLRGRRIHYGGLLLQLRRQVRVGLALRERSMAAQSRGERAVPSMRRQRPQREELVTWA